MHYNFFTLLFFTSLKNIKISIEAVNRQNIELQQNYES